MLFKSAVFQGFTLSHRTKRAQIPEASMGWWGGGSGLGDNSGFGVMGFIVK